MAPGADYHDAFQPAGLGKRHAIKGNVRITHALALIREREAARYNSRYFALKCQGVRFAAVLANDGEQGRGARVRK